MVVVDTGNYYPRQRDGVIPEIAAGLPESRWVERQIGRPVVKAFNNIYAKHLMENGRPRGDARRIALPVSGDDPKVAEAVNYVLKQWTRLNVFYSDGAVPIDNNVSEREMKRVALNRKNSIRWQPTRWANGRNPGHPDEHLPPARGGSTVVSHSALNEPTPGESE